MEGWDSRRATVVAVAGNEKERERERKRECVGNRRFLALCPAQTAAVQHVNMAVVMETRTAHTTTLPE